MKFAFIPEIEGLVPTDPLTGQPRVQELPADVVVVDMPAFPTAQPGFALVWRDGALTQAEDRRGEDWYDTATRARTVLAQLGPPPAGHTRLPPPAAGPRDTVSWDASKGQWKVTPETAAAKAAREAQEEAAARAAAREAMSLSNVELSEALYKAGKITGPEAEAFAATGAVPASMMAAIEQAMTAAGLSADDKTLARIRLKGLMVYRRMSPLVPIMGAALQMDAEALDRLFGQKDAA
jgi:hypothetical protein